MPAIAMALEEVARLKREYVGRRAVFLKGAQLIPLLRAFGATDADLDALRQVSDGLPKDPTLPFRRSRNGRFRYDEDGALVRRLEFQPFVLSAEEDFVRHDSGRIRRFEEIRTDLTGNSVLAALMIFKYLMFSNVEVVRRPKLDYGCREWISTVFHLRTITTPELLGQPALEGVHSDGVDHTMTTFIGGDNMTDDSAITYLHDMRERNGTPWAKVDQELVVGSCRHSDFLDTLLVADHERKHSLSVVAARDGRRNATRDMLIFFTRRPALDNHVSYSYDSRAPHPDMPMEIDLSPYAAGFPDPCRVPAEAVAGHHEGSATWAR